MKTRLLQRLVVGLALGTVVSAAIFLPPPVTALVVAVWSTVATIEFLAILRQAEIVLSRWLLVGANLLLVIAAWFGLLPAGLIAAVGAVWLFSVAERETRPRVFVYGAFVVFYLGFLPAHLVLLRNLVAERGWSGWVAFFPLGITWLADSAAWLVGTLIGRRPLAPQVSPKKTVEGYVAALAASGIATGLLLGRLRPFGAGPWWWLVAVGMALATLGQAGDLFESTFKRAVGMKDSSRLLGEHGGFLDRVDSLLFVLPAFYHLLVLVGR